MSANSSIGEPSYTAGADNIFNWLSNNTNNSSLLLINNVNDREK